MSLISIQNVSVEITGQNILHDVTLDLSAGEILTIVGPNGSGKSTLLRVIVGALAPTKGKITRQKDIRIGYVPQTLAIDATLPMNVDRFLSIPRWASKNEKLAALERVGATNMMHKQMTDLSGGQFQRVLLARALLCEPDVLLLDEPTQGLDQPGSARFYELIAEIRAELNCAVVMVSHELHVVMSASDRVVCLNGHVCCHGTPETVSNAPEYRALFGAQTGGALALYRHEHDHGHDHHHEH
ncbi:zinc ABC transporter ATP-binding protein ZnuC [Amylibacter kogurei]|uniref:Zinc ABC transporter ATP-binding protein ZnuC n=1 Tax=Paramylibacter kogurei TaxID=1889778 RepID=A0A2G5K2K7_9RHOB|nr:zinc ABC transporter ATP-binding protein ZnuC [Amylibacter kogurei]PIB23160.1 zinc ABC transporter ATP-binding protein ZnuC [Amylibacter kogurei]